MLNTSKSRVRYTRQSIATNTFLQMPRFIMVGEFAGNRISNNARILYTLLLDRHKISIKNGWHDENGDVYIYFKREEMEQQLGISERTVVKVIQELKTFSLVEEKKQGLNKPNKIYLLSPVISDDEDFAQYIDPTPDYNPDAEQNYTSEVTTATDIAEPVITSSTEPQNLRLQAHIDCASKPVNFTAQEPQNLSPNYNKYSNNEINNNEINNNEVSNTTATGSSKIPYQQILEMYNRLCEATSLRPIRLITGNRQTQTAARFKEYGLSGFFDLFEKVAASIFLCGGGDGGWKADYDWLITPANMQKVLEGKYDNDQCNIPLPQVRLGESRNTGISSNNQRQDPFMERALTAYATATQQTA